MNIKRYLNFSKEIYIMIDKIKMLLLSVGFLFMFTGNVVAQDKTAATAELENLAKLDVLFTSDVISAAKTNVEAATTQEEIDAVLAGVYTTVNGKNIRLQNNGSGDRSTYYMNSSGTYAYSTSSVSNSTIWIIRDCSDGTFKLENFATGLFIGSSPGTLVAEENAIKLEFKFSDPGNSDTGKQTSTLITNNSNKAALMSGDIMLHQANYSPYALLNYRDIADDASVWTISLVENIKVSSELYQMAASLDKYYYLQQKYGLVQDAGYYTSNYKDPYEGSYEALLDGVYADPSYFHSSYRDGATGDDVPAHYLQADLGDGNGVESFYFYYKKRGGNNNNRPTSIIVWASNSTEESDFTQIKTIDEGLPTESSVLDYLSDPVELGSSYRYLRFTVNVTNNNTKFFTFSEFYILPSGDDVKDVLDFDLNSVDVTGDDIEDAVNKNMQGVLYPYYDEAVEILNANSSNYSDVPGIGQYSTADYETLQAVATTALAGEKTKDELQAAIATFEASKCKPIFNIISAYNSTTNTLAYGSFLMENNGLLNYITADATSGFDTNTMWVLDITGTAVTVADDVGITNFGTGNIMAAGSSNLGTSATINIVETTPSDDTDWQFLISPNDGTSYDGCFMQPYSYPTIGRWSSSADAVVQANGEGAWTFSYVATTYELQQIAQALELHDDLYVLYNENAALADVVLGDNPGYHSETEEGALDTLKTALTNANNYMNGKSIGDYLNATDVSAIETELSGYAEAIAANAEKIIFNQPKTGRFYRVKGVYSGNYMDGGNLAGTKVGLKAESERSNAGSIFYLNDESKPLNYLTGTYLYQTYNMGSYTTTEQNIWSFSESSAEYSFIITATNSSQSKILHDSDSYVDRCGSTPDDEEHEQRHSWIIENVESLPVTTVMGASEAYATLHAPVALSVADGCTAYTAFLGDDVLNLTEITSGVIPAETAVIVVSATAGTYEFEILYENTDEMLQSDLGGTIETIATSDVTNPYTLQIHYDEAGMYEYIGVALKPFRAYLSLSSPTSANGLRLNFVGTTAVENVECGTSENKVVYDLCGRRIDGITAPGIYIVDGRKVILKQN